MKYWIIMVVSLAVFSCAENDNDNKKDISQRQVIDKLKTDIARFPDSAGLRMRLINSYDSVRMYKEAISQTDSLIKRDSLNNGLWFTKGQLQEDSKDTSA